ncbi:MAG: hypothetical protein HZY75_11940 [Nocardioidaceae bacterium]|nr:MAG: hypothetical protein HZY75_11940 [Nocardioidaceae bacterium]
MLSGTARPHLEALVKKGVVTREKVGRSVHWRWVGDAVDMSVIAHLDFETPSEVDLMIEALREAGVEVEYIADPAQGARGGLYSGAIEYRSNGPLSHFRIGLWEQATKSELLSALRSADRLVQGDPQALGKYGKCLGTEVRR